MNRALLAIAIVLLPGVAWAQTAQQKQWEMEDQANHECDISSFGGLGLRIGPLLWRGAAATMISIFIAPVRVSVCGSPIHRALAVDASGMPLHLDLQCLCLTAPGLRQRPRAFSSHDWPERSWQRQEDQNRNLSSARIGHAVSGRDRFARGGECRCCVFKG